MGIQGPGEGYYELIGGLALGAGLLVVLAIAIPIVWRRRHRGSMLAGLLVVTTLILGSYAWAVNRDDTHPLDDELSASVDMLTSSYEQLGTFEPAGGDPTWIENACDADPDGGYLTSAGQVDRRIDIEGLAPQLEQDGFTTGWTRNAHEDINGIEARRGNTGLTIRVFTDYSSLHFQYGPCIPDP